MAREESFLGCSYNGSSGGGGGASGGGGRGDGCSKSKKIKPKKVPQRGLGVAQLEKIRIEEQQKKESLQAANILAKNAVGDSTPFLAFRPNLSHFHNSAPDLEILQENSVHLCSKQLNNADGVEHDSKAILNPRLWDGDFNLARDKLRLDRHVFSFDPNLNSSSSSSSMVNSSSGIQPLPVLSSPIEPPSNQNFRSKNYSPFWTEEDKMVGMKRHYPFSLESPPAPSFSFHPTNFPSSSKSDDLALCSNGYTDRLDTRKKGIRVGPPNSTEKKLIEVTRDDQRLNGDFLTLAPPFVASPPLIMRNERFSGYSDYHTQENGESRLHHLGSVQVQPFSFFPVKSQSSKTGKNGRGEKGEAIDLNLKL